MNEQKDQSSNKYPAVAALVVALAAVAGIGAYSLAASDTPATTDVGQGRGRGMYMSDAERTQWEADRTTRQAQMDAKRTAIEAAITANDFKAWQAAVGTGAPVLEKVSAENFTKFVEAHQYMEKARTIFEELGIDQGGFGKGGPGMMGGRGMHRGMMGE